MIETRMEMLQARIYPPQVSKVHEKKGGDITTSDCIIFLYCVEVCSYEGCLKNNMVGKPIYKSKNWLKS